MRSLPFALLRPVSSKPRQDITLLTDWDLDTVSFIWEEFSDNYMAFDYETNGHEPHENGYIVGIGFSDSRGSIYLNLGDDYLDGYPKLSGILRNVSNIPLLAHNLFFEMHWTDHVLTGQSDVSMTYYGCTYANYRHLANEGWLGQEYGLKAAQKDLLGWKETNEIDLDNWLIDNGHISNISKTYKDGYYQRFTAKGNRFLSPDKSKMYLAPPETLGKYCALDADATYQLQKLVFDPCLSKFPMLNEYLRGDYVDYISILVRQKTRGVKIDLTFLADYRKELQTRVSSLELALYNLYKEHLDLFTNTLVDEVLDSEPNRYLRSDALGPEPTRYTNRGEVTVRWLRWEHERVLRSHPDWRPTQSKNWEDWLQKYITTLCTATFNWNSGPQREWLFYEWLGYPCLVTTDTGARATGEEALLGFGEGGKLLLELIQTEKAISSIDSLENITVDGIYHPSLRMPGTHTGRLAGAGGYNWQNPPKSKYMQAFVARPNHSIISFDIASLENVVLTEASRDSVLWSIYGPGAKPNDGYLFFGSMLPVIGPKIKATGYDPYNPTRESIAAAKKLAGKERSISKVIVLSSSYGAGPAKIHETLSLSGVDITLEECQEIHSGYWALLGDVKKWEKDLLRQWYDNRGWLLNLVGRPICVDKDYRKDITNRVIQSSGHDLFIQLLLETVRRTSHLGVEPWSADVHDCFYLEMPTSAISEFNRILVDEVLPAWNTRIGGTIPLQGSPNTITNLWLDKAEGKDLELAKEYAKDQEIRLKKEASDAARKERSNSQTPSSRGGTTSHRPQLREYREPTGVCPF